MKPELTDALCAIGLDNAIIALKQASGFAKNESVRQHPAFDGIVENVVALGLANIGTLEEITLKDYIAVIKKIKKSVILHSEWGPRGYYDFIQDYV